MTTPAARPIATRGDAPGRARPRLVVLTNIPTPYRTPFFDALAERMELRGLDLHVLYCAEREPNRHWTIDRAAIRHPHTVLPGVHWTVGPAFVHFNPGVVRAIRALAPRWLVSGGAWHTPTMLLALHPRVHRGARLVLWNEGHADAVLHARGPISALRRRVFARYDAVAAPNARSARYALEEAGRTIPVLPLANTVDEDFYLAPPDHDRAAYRTRLGLPASTRLILSVCQLEDRKSVVELARAYAALGEAATRGTLLAFLGEGPRRAEVEAIARSVAGGEIRLLGHVDTVTVRDWLWAADAFVLATRNDPNPLSPIEASFAGLPLLLSTKAGNVDELVVEGETGFRLESVDDESIRAGLTRVLSCPADRLRQMGDAARANALRSFRRSAVCDRFVEALLEALPA